jgi:hypothetical protein
MSPTACALNQHAAAAQACALPLCHSCQFIAMPFSSLLPAGRILLVAQQNKVLGAM